MKISIWKDPWIIDIPDRIPKAKDGVDIRGLEKVIDLRKENGMGWDEAVIHATFPEETATAILNLEWPAITSEDQLIWCGNPKGIFSVQNCHAINNMTANPVEEIWNKTVEGSYS